MFTLNLSVFLSNVSVSWILFVELADKTRNIHTQTLMFWTSEEAVLFLHFHPPVSQLSGSFIHPPDCPPPLPEKSVHSQHIPDDPTWHFPCGLSRKSFDLVPVCPSNTSQTPSRQAGIITLWPAFPSSHHQVFKSAQVSHQRESEYEEKRIIGKCQPCDGRCLNAVPKFVYFPLHRCAHTSSRLLLSPTYSRLSNPLWQDSRPW